MREADPLTSSPFVDAIEPITETDDEIARALDDAEVPPLLPALAYLTGDLSLLRDDLRPDPLLVAALPQGGLTDDQLAAARALALETLVALPRRRLRRRAAAVRRRPAAGSWSTRSARRGLAAYLPLLEEELGGPRRGPPGARLAPRRPRTRRRRSASWSSARACRASSPRTGCSRPASRSWSSRRTTTSAARGSRTPIRAAASTTRTTTTATRSRSATTGRCTSRPRTCCSTTSALRRRVRAPRPHPVRHRGRSRRRGPTPSGAWTVRTRDARRARGRRSTPTR